MIRVLFIGDIVGKPGRKAVKELLPKLREEFEFDLVIANVENIAHGVGVTRSSLEEVRRVGVDVATSGNHIWAKDEGVELLSDSTVPLLRPANYPPGLPGSGARVVSVGSRELLILNLQGRVFMNEGVDDPFRAVDALLKEYANRTLAGTIVDFHAEATSEKVAFGWYLDGRVSAVLGTHTHVPTADGWIMPGGTAFVADVGMTGAKHSVIGVDREPVLKKFLTGLPTRFDIPEDGPAVFRSVVVTMDPDTGKSTSIERLDREIWA